MQSITHLHMYTYTCTAIIPMQACAHRYLELIDGTPYPVGRCFFSGRTLEGFTEYSPCSDGKKNKHFVQHTHLCIFVNILIALVTIVVSIAIDLLLFDRGLLLRRMMAIFYSYRFINVSS